MADDNAFAHLLSADMSVPSDNVFAHLAPKDGKPRFNIDFSRPRPEVRAEIAKLPEKQREEATRQWADARAQAGIKDEPIAALSPRTVHMPIVTPLMERAAAAVQAGLHAAGSDTFGPYDENLAMERAKGRAAHAANPVLSTVGGIASGVLLPVPGGPAATFGSRIAQSGAVGAGYGAAEGALDAEGGKLEGALRGGLAGGAIGLGLGSAGELIPAARRLWAGQGRSGAYQKAVEGLSEAPAGTTPVDQLADQIATGAGNGSAAARRRALDILGEEMERAGGDRAVAIPATVQRISTEANVTPATADAHLRELTNVHADSPLMFGEAQTVAGSDAAMRGQGGRRIQPRNADLDALGRVQESALADRFDYLANNGNMLSATTARNALRRRQEDLSPTFEATVENMPGAPRVATGPRTSRPANITDVEALTQQATDLARNSYRAAYSGPTDQQAVVNWLPRLLNRFEQMAQGRSGEYAAAMRKAADQFYAAGSVAAPAGASGAIGSPMGRQVMTSMRQLQDARTAVRGQMTGYRREGRDDLAAAVQPIYDNITRLMEYANPVWGRANRQWADMRFSEIGQELGDAFARKAGPRFREQLREFQALAPEAQNIVRVHFLQQVKDKLDNLGDTHSISKMFANDHTRNAIRQLFGDEAAVTFTRAVRDQVAAEQTQKALGGAQTNRRQQAQKQMDTESGLVAAVQTASPKEARNAILQWFVQRANESRNRPLAQILSTPMSDTAAIAQHIHNMRREADRLRQLSQPSRVPLPLSAMGGGLLGDYLAPGTR